MAWFCVSVGHVVHQRAWIVRDRIFFMIAGPGGHFEASNNLRLFVMRASVEATRHSRHSACRNFRCSKAVPGCDAEARRLPPPRPSHRTPSIRTARAAADARFSTPSLA
jgi:hypothetical protein